MKYQLRIIDKRQGQLYLEDKHNYEIPAVTTISLTTPYGTAKNVVDNLYRPFLALGELVMKELENQGIAKRVPAAEVSVDFDDTSLYDGKVVRATMLKNRVSADIQSAERYLENPLQLIYEMFCTGVRL